MLLVHLMCRALTRSLTLPQALVVKLLTLRQQGGERLMRQPSLLQSRDPNFRSLLQASTV